MVLSFFWDWLRGRLFPTLGHLHFQMYTRRGCHLCEQAWECLRVEQRRFRFCLEAVDVDTAPELAARFGEQVPVVMIDGKVRFRGGVNRVLLHRLLCAESRRQ